MKWVIAIYLIMLTACTVVMIGTDRDTTVDILSDKKPKEKK